MAAKLDPEQVRAIYATELAPEEFHRLLAEELADEEAMAGKLAHIRWFKRRYPTPLVRPQFAQHMTVEWTKRRVPSSR